MRLGNGCNVIPWACEWKRVELFLFIVRRRRIPQPFCISPHLVRDSDCALRRVRGLGVCLPDGFKAIFSVYYILLILEKLF